MNPSFRMWWLIIIACVAFHSSGWHTAVVLVGYAVAEYLDQWQAKKARAKVLEDVMYG